MFLSAVSVLVVAQSSSEIPEGLMNNSVFLGKSFYNVLRGLYLGGILTIIMEELSGKRELKRGIWVLTSFISGTEKDHSKP